MADEVENPPEGWYEDPSDPTRLRYWDGSQWLYRFREHGTQPEAADQPREPSTESSVAGPSVAARKSAPVQLPRWFWVVLIVATLGILWGAAEQHDQGCYNKVLAQVASGNTDQTHCLLLPWNDPAEGSSTFR